MHYVLYASKRPAETTEEDIENIILSAERNNKNTQITGVLLIKVGFFLQYFEGPEHQVATLLDTLSHDDRHTDIKILDQGEILERLFPEWQMMPIKHSIDHHGCIERINNSPLPHLRHLLIKYFVNEGPVSIAYGEMPY